MKTLLVIPTYNEVDNLRPLLSEIFAQVPKRYVIVDDNSTIVQANSRPDTYRGLTGKCDTPSR